MTALTLHATQSAATADAAAWGDSRNYRGRDAALATPQSDHRGATLGNGAGGFSLTPAERLG
jgi:hypothetical protein